FFGPFTGAPLLRKDPPDRYVFNYRASYAEETNAIVRHLVDIRRIKSHDIAVFAQADSYGDAGFEGVARAMRRYGRDPAKIMRLSYQRNTADVADAVNELSKQQHSHIRAVVCVATYKAAAKLIEKMRERGSEITFTNVSFVGSNALAEELAALGPRFAQGAIVTQVVPLPHSSTRPRTRSGARCSTKRASSRPSSWTNTSRDGVARGARTHAGTADTNDVTPPASERAVDVIGGPASTPRSAPRAPRGPERSPPT